MFGRAFMYVCTKRLSKNVIGEVYIWLPKSIIISIEIVGSIRYSILLIFEHK